MSKTAIVIGSTGLVGSHLVEQLAASSHIDKVISLTRRKGSSNSPKIENHVCDFEMLSDYAELFVGDYFFSCLGTTRRQVGSIEAQRKVDLELQYLATQLAIENGVKQLFLVSSSGANANSGNPYLRMKGELENRVRELGFEAVTIFQPSLLVGKRSSVRVGESIANCILPLVCRIPGLQQYRPIQGELVAKKMVEISKLDNTGVQVFRLAEVFPAE